MGTDDDVIETPRPGEVFLRLHSVTAVDTHLSAAVFEAKLRSLIRALRAADRAVNSRLEFDYGIVKMRSSSPTMIIAQQPMPTRRANFFASSSVDAFEECVDAILSGNETRALRFGKCAKHVRDLASGSPKLFGYGELCTQRRAVRLDVFLEERAEAVAEPPNVPVEPAIDAGDVWYKGEAYGSFEGMLEYVDVRGSMPEIKLIMPAGGKSIDCVCRSEHLDIIGASLKRRVRVYGSAFYDGKSGLPRRINVTTIELVRDGGDFRRWRGSFEPFEIEPWMNDSD